MVNYGQPSRDCFPCRKRKLRCDLRTGECSQCHRAGLTCYGYRDISELCFRDETFTTAQKALARHASTLRPTAAPQLTWDELSRNVFLSLYVVKLSHSFDALGPLLAKSPVNGHLHASVGAASLAFMAFHHGDPSLMPLANRRYLGAVQSLGLGLRNSQHSASDEILQSVLLLDLYEKIANRNAQQPASWMSHAQGALSVVKSRASNDFSSPITCQLANRVATAVIISAGAAASLVPDTLGPLRKALGRYVRGPKWNFMNLMVGVVNLRADMRSAASSLAGSADHLRRAKELDTQLALVESNTSRSWRPRRVFAMTHEPLVFGHYYDIYPSHYATQVFNAIRMMRLEMCDIIRNLDAEEHSNIYSPVSQTISEMTLRLCAAVPQFLLPGARAENTVPLSPLQMLQCCTMLTPLYVSAQLTVDRHLRAWIMRCIAHMTDSGVKMSQDISYMLNFTPEVDYWTVYTRAGSYAIAA